MQSSVPCYSETSPSYCLGLRGRVAILRQLWKLLRHGNGNAPELATQATQVNAVARSEFTSQFAAH